MSDASPRPWYLGSPMLSGSCPIWRDGAGEPAGTIKREVDGDLIAAAVTPAKVG